MSKPLPVEAVSRLETVSRFSSDFLRHRKLDRRGVEAAIWGMPLVSFDTMRQAFFRAGAKYGDILYFSKFADCKFQVPTPNASSLYVYFNFNLKNGPVVVEFPAAVGAGLCGSLVDAWQVPLTDVGPEGEDHGKGGKYLLLPPGYRANVPKDHFPVRSPTYNGYAAFRVIVAGTSPEDFAKAIELVKKMRVHAYAPEHAPTPSRHIDIAGKPFDGIVRFNDTFYDSLARLVNEEPVQTQDLVPMAQFRDIGIEKGKPFAPNEATREILRGAAAEAQAWLMQSIAGGQPHWTGTHWLVPPPAGAKTGFSFASNDHLDVDARGTLFFSAFAVPKKPGAASFHVASFCDADGARFAGATTYRLRIPAHVPVSQFWAVTVYDPATAAFIRDAPHVAIDSYQNVQRNADGSLNVYFSPTAPAGREHNWIHTTPGQPWFTLFRFYGPAKAVFDRSWKLPDIERL